MKRPKMNSTHEAYANALSSKGCWQKGQLVRSIAGRDNGRYYLVLAEESGFFWVADGRKRKAANPKRKNKHHLQVVWTVAADLRNLPSDVPPTDEKIRACLASLNSSNQ